MQNSGNLQEVLHGSMVQNNKLKGFISSALLYSAPPVQDDPRIHHHGLKQRRFLFKCPSVRFCSSFPGGRLLIPEMLIILLGDGYIHALFLVQPDKVVYLFFVRRTIALE